MSTGYNNIYYETAHNSEDIVRTFVLCHGAGATGRYMRLIANEIVNKIPNSKVINIDLPFHGESTSTFKLEGMNVNDYAAHSEELLTLLDDEGELIGDVNWVGWSMGGSIGLLIGLEGSYIDELTLISSSPYWKEAELMVSIPALQSNDTAKAGFKEIISNEVKGLGLGVADAISNRYGQITATGDVIREDFKGVGTAHYDLRESLGSIRVPTLIFSGTKDTLAPQEVQEFMHKEINNSKLIYVEDTHTTVLNRESVEVLVREMRDFFE